MGPQGHGATGGPETVCRIMVSMHKRVSNMVLLRLDLSILKDLLLTCFWHLSDKSATWLQALKYKPETLPTFRVWIYAAEKPKKQSEPCSVLCVQTRFCLWSSSSLTLSWEPFTSRRRAWSLIWNEEVDVTALIGSVRSVQHDSRGLFSTWVCLVALRGLSVWVSWLWWLVNEMNRLLLAALLDLTSKKILQCLSIVGCGIFWLGCNDRRVSWWVSSTLQRSGVVMLYIMLPFRAGILPSSTHFVNIVTSVEPGPERPQTSRWRQGGSISSFSSFSFLSNWYLIPIIVSIPTNFAFATFVVEIREMPL